MKKMLLVLVVLSFSAVASLERIYMQRIETSGHVTPEYAMTKKCTVYLNGIVTFTTYHYTNMVKKEVKNYGIKKGSRINKIIDAAFDGDMVKEVYPVDASSVKYVAGFKKGEEERLVTLYDANGETGVKIVNDSVQAKRLKVQIDHLCK